MSKIIVGQIFFYSVFGPALFSLLLDPADVLLPILGVGYVGVRLGWTLLVRVAHEVLNAQQDLGDGQTRPPILVLVQNRQTDCTRGVNVRMEKHRVELALGWLVRVVLCELEGHLVHTAFPKRLCQ